MEVKTDALVLRTVDIGETDKMLTLLTSDFGKIGAKIKGVRARTAKLKFAAQPFCFAEYVLAVQGERKTVIGAAQYEGFFSLRESVENYYAACVVTETCDKLFLEGMQGAEMLVSAVTALKSLETCENDDLRSFLLVKFLLQALRIAGYPVRAGECPVCGKTPRGRMEFDMESGVFSCEGCAKGTPASEVTYKVIREALEGGEAFEADGLKRALRLLSAYADFQAELSIKALGEYMKMTFSS